MDEVRTFNRTRISYTLILLAGKSPENLDLVVDPDKNFVVIMKDGTIYKSTVN